MKMKLAVAALALCTSVNSLAQSMISTYPTLFECKMSKDVGRVLLSSWGAQNYDYVKVQFKQMPVTDYSNPPKIVIGAYAIKKQADGSETNFSWKRLDRVTGSQVNGVYSFAYSSVGYTDAAPFLAVIQESGQATIQRIGNVTYGWKYSHPQAFFCEKKNELVIAKAFNANGKTDEQMMQAIDNLDSWGSGTRQSYGGYYSNGPVTGVFDANLQSTLSQKVSDHIEATSKVLTDEDGQLLLFGQTQPCGGTELESLTAVSDYLGNKVGYKGTFVCKDSFKTETTNWGRTNNFHKQMTIYFTVAGLIKASLDKGQINEVRKY